MHLFCRFLARQGLELSLKFMLDPVELIMVFPVMGRRPGGSFLQVTEGVFILGVYMVVQQRKHLVSESFQPLECGGVSDIRLSQSEGKCCHYIPQSLVRGGKRLDRTHLNMVCFAQRWNDAFAVDCKKSF